MRNGLVSVVIVNWNHGEYLAACLEALKGQTYPDVEVTVVDNASRDGSPDLVRDLFPEVGLVEFTTNSGFSRAFNAGVRNSQGEFVLSLNPDVTVEPGFIAALVRAMTEDERSGAAAPRLLRLGNDRLIDSAGLFIDRRRRPYDRGQLAVNDPRFDRPAEVFGACGAAALFRRAMLEDLAYEGEYFDEDFFAYYEDADLAWRAQSRGWRCLYVPGAVARHARGWGDTLRKGSRSRGNGPRLALRNRYLMTLKNDIRPFFLADLPLIFAAEIPRLIYMAFTHPAALLGLADLARLASRALKKRASIQRDGVVAPGLVRRWFITHPI